MLGKLPYDPFLPNNSYYPPNDKVRKLDKDRTITYHNKNKVCYDAHFLPVKFEVGDTNRYEEFHCSNMHILSPPYSGPYPIWNQLSDITFEIDKPIHILKEIQQLFHSSKLRYYNRL